MPENPWHGGPPQSRSTWPFLGNFFPLCTGSLPSASASMIILSNKLQSAVKTSVLALLALKYGNTGCGVLKGRIQNQKGFWLKIDCIQMKLPNFENWSNGKLSKIGHHFSNKRLLKLILSKNVNNNKCAP